MSKLVPFTFETAEVRVVEIDGEPWFVGKDVAEVLGYERTADAIRTHCKGSVKHRLPTAGGVQDVILIPERDLYRLIMRSKLPAAERFEEWVVAQVFPSIRKSGGYGAPQIDPANLSRLQLIEMAMQAERERLVLEAKVAADHPKVEFYDRFANVQGLYGLQNAGRVLGHPPNKFVEQLKALYLFYQGGSLVPRAEYQDRGLFKVMAVEAGGHARYQTYVTPKGLQYFAGRLKKADDLPNADLLSQLV